MANLEDYNRGQLELSELDAREQLDMSNLMDKGQPTLHAQMVSQGHSSQSTHGVYSTQLQNSSSQNENSFSLPGANVYSLKGTTSPISTTQLQNTTTGSSESGNKGQSSHVYSTQLPTSSLQNESNYTLQGSNAYCSKDTSRSTQLQKNSTFENENNYLLPVANPFSSHYLQMKNENGYSLPNDNSYSLENTSLSSDTLSSQQHDLEPSSQADVKALSQLEEDSLLSQDIDNEPSTPNDEDHSPEDDNHTDNNNIAAAATSVSVIKEESRKRKETTPQSKYEYKRRRSFQPKWTSSFTGLIDTPEGMICTICKLFSKSKSSDSAFVTGCKSYRLENVRAHWGSSLHQKSCGSKGDYETDNKAWRMASSNPADLHEMVRQMVPQLHHGMHKGEAGRIAVVGGCQEYTGAPYFAAISALKVGADLSHVFCTSDAATAIKCYSPELIVHPILDSDDFLVDMANWLPRFHTLVIGPGLGRDKHTLSKIEALIELAKLKKMPIIIDADGLFLVTENPDCIKGDRNVVLTPNVVEFGRLFKKVFKTSSNHEDSVADVVKLSAELGHVTIVHKGMEDIISDGEKVVICNEESSPRRCGGQGDLLSGSLGTFCHWAYMVDEATVDGSLLATHGRTMCAAYAACLLTRSCNSQAFQEHGRSMTTTDMVGQIHTAFEKLFVTE